MTLYRRKPQNWLQRIWFWVRAPKIVEIYNLRRAEQDFFGKPSYRYESSEMQANIVASIEWFEANYEAVK